MTVRAAPRLLKAALLDRRRHGHALQRERREQRRLRPVRRRRLGRLGGPGRRRWRRRLERGRRRHLSGGRHPQHREFDSSATWLWAARAEPAERPRRRRREDLRSRHDRRECETRTPASPARPDGMAPRVMPRPRGGARRCRCRRRLRRQSSRRGGTLDSDQHIGPEIRRRGRPWRQRRCGRYRSAGAPASKGAPGAALAALVVNGGTVATAVPVAKADAGGAGGAGGAVVPEGTPPEAGLRSRRYGHDPSTSKRLSADNAVGGRWRAPVALARSVRPEAKDGAGGTAARRRRSTGTAGQARNGGHLQSGRGRGSAAVRPATPVAAAGHGGNGGDAGAGRQRRRRRQWRRRWYGSRRRHAPSCGRDRQFDNQVSTFYFRRRNRRRGWSRRQRRMRVQRAVTGRRGRLRSHRRHRRSWAAPAARAATAASLFTEVLRRGCEEVPQARAAWAATAATGVAAARAATAARAAVAASGRATAESAESARRWMAVLGGSLSLTYRTVVSNNTATGGKGGKGGTGGVPAQVVTPAQVGPAALAARAATAVRRLRRRRRSRHARRRRDGAVAAKAARSHGTQAGLSQAARADQAGGEERRQPLRRHGGCRRYGGNKRQWRQRRSGGRRLQRRNGLTCRRASPFVGYTRGRPDPPGSMASPTLRLTGAAGPDDRHR